MDSVQNKVNTFFFHIEFNINISHTILHGYINPLQKSLRNDVILEARRGHYYSYDEFLFIYILNKKIEVSGYKLNFICFSNYYNKIINLKFFLYT